MSQKKKLPTYTTPRGTFAYPWLGKPDVKFDPNKPIYKLSIILDRSDEKVAQLLEKLDTHADEAVAGFKQDILDKAPNNPKGQKEARAKCDEMKRQAPYIVEEDENGEETGNVILRVKMNAQYTDPKTKKVVEMKPTVFNAKNVRIDPTKVNIGGGSVGQVAFEVLPFYNASSKSAGASLRMKGVRVLKVESYGGVDAQSLFGAAEDGWDDGDVSGDSGESDSTSGSGGESPDDQEF